MHLLSYLFCSVLLLLLLFIPFPLKWIPVTLATTFKIFIFNFQFVMSLEVEFSGEFLWNWLGSLFKFHISFKSVLNLFPTSRDW